MSGPDATARSGHEPSGTTNAGTEPSGAVDPIGEPSATAKPRIGRHFRLQWEEAQQAHVLLYPEGMVKLNASAGAILCRCDGERTIAAIVAELEQAYGASGLAADVTAFVALAVGKKWLEIPA